MLPQRLELLQQLVVPQVIEQKFAQGGRHANLLARWVELHAVAVGMLTIENLDLFLLSVVEHPREPVARSRREHVGVEHVQAQHVLEVNAQVGLFCLLMEVKYFYGSVSRAREQLLGRQIFQGCYEVPVLVKLQFCGGVQAVQRDRAIQPTRNKLGAGGVKAHRQVVWLLRLDKLKFLLFLWIPQNYILVHATGSKGILIPITRIHSSRMTTQCPT